MKRTINHTRKKRIPKGQIDIKVIKKRERLDSFRADIDLDGLGLPGEAQVYVEAYRRFQWNRYDFGRVNSLGAREPLDMGDLSHSETVSFRVLVKSESGVILALAEEVKPSEKQAKTPLLPVDFDNLGHLIWDLEFQRSDGGPMLVLNKNLPKTFMLEQARFDEQFILTVYPEVLRQVLARIIYGEENAKRIDDLPDGWQRDWVRMATNILPEKEPPEVLDPSDSEFRRGEARKWLNDVKKEFAQKRTDEWRNLLDFVERNVV